jgi:DNA mismatch repair protein MutS2
VTSAPDVHLPDLLHASPTRRIDFETTETAMALAFAGGTSGGLFADALVHATIAPSTWNPAHHANDLFLNQFASTCLQIQIDGSKRSMMTSHLVRTLASPPSQLETVQFRREIFEELCESAQLRGAVERLYKTICRFRALLEGTDTSGKWDVNRRQLDLLGAFKQIIELMAVEFATARSGLSRLAAFGTRVGSSEGFGALADLLRYDAQLAKLSFKVGIGADGRVRSLEILSLEENAENTFVSPPWRRWLSKIELFLRGYRFGDGEVMARLLDAVFEGIKQELPPLVVLLGDLEFYLGALAFRAQAEAAGLAVCLPELVAPSEPRSFKGLFNPLLLGHGIPPVPCDIDTDRHDTTLLITGPNSGGKTRLLQSFGLAQLLLQSGVCVPARAARMSLAPALVMSLIQQTHVDQSEGRLGMELMRIRSLFEQLPPSAVVILDELCSGTNPSEGEEIFELVVRMLARLKPQAFITTHFLQFAARLERESRIEGLRFLQVLLGPEHQPTYQFGPGVAETSLASQAAARLGVTADQLLGLIERNIDATRRRGAS